MIKTLATVDGDLAEAAWTLYRTAFAPLATLAVQRHVMHRDEFDQIMGDERLDKLLLLDNDAALAGVGAVTTNLDAVPLISTDYFAHSWPRLYEARRIWWVAFLAVPGHDTGAFVELVGDMFRTAASLDGMVGLDVCTHNDLVLQLPRIIGLSVRRLSGGESRYKRVDSQLYYLFDVTGRNQL